jgi:hypothetical protein
MRITDIGGLGNVHAARALVAVVVAASSFLAPGAALAADPGAVAPAISDTSTYASACPDPGPGLVRCFALERTDIAPLTAGQVSPASGPSGLSPASLQAAYNLPSGSGGAGMTVAIVDAYHLPNAESILATYRSQFGLPACTSASLCFRQVDQSGGTNYPASAVTYGWASEIALDMDMVSAICPLCKILLVEANTTTIDDLGTAVNTAVALGANAISNSYGTSGESPSETTWDTYFNHPGVIVTAATGDCGYNTHISGSGCGSPPSPPSPEYPAASPWVLAVGGTSLVTASNSRGWTETAWANAGSGCSLYEPKPSWQTDSDCAKRASADISAVADPNTGVAVYDPNNGGWRVYGGTSASAPIIAAAYMLAGQPAPNSYPFQRLYSTTAGLNDVTSGSNGSCGGGYICTAGVGYDGPTGLGTPAGTTALAPTPPAVPGLPTGVAATRGNVSAHVTWTAPLDDGGNTISLYAVTSAPGGFTCTNTTAAGCTVGGLTNGKSYTFTVTATNNAGQGLPSDPSTPVIPATSPGAPTGVTGIGSDGQAVISWTAPAANGSAITGFVVTSSPDGKTCSTTSATSCTVSGLTNRTQYQFTVVATSDVGPGAPSAESADITPLAGSTYMTLTPNRLVDSRPGPNQQGLGGNITSGTPASFQVTGRVPSDVAKNVPATATAVTGNLTVTDQTSRGYLSLTPLQPSGVPSTSTLNFPVSDVRANGVTVPLGAGGVLWVTFTGVPGAKAAVVFDVTGYFTM